MSPPGTIVVALGGNALQPPGSRVTIADQFRHTRESLAAVVELARAGWRVAIVHGNGPQVGDALQRNEQAVERVEPLPLGLLVASTAGWIGYMIQQSMQNALSRAGIEREVLTIITQAVVDVDQPEAMAATKPIGHTLTPEGIAHYRSLDIPVREDSRGRWRRLAPSPMPVDVVEAEAIKHLVERGAIVIAGGGGGTPVYRHAKYGWEGVDAVVDKDRVAAIIGTRLAADTLMILTDVDAVYRGWNTPAQEALPQLTLAEATTLLDGDELGGGSMRPKVEAAVAFVRDGGRRAVIAELHHGPAALRGETGTTVTM